MSGEKESTRKTFAAKLAVSGKESTWITGDRRATGPSNIHAFGALAGFFLAFRDAQPAVPCPGDERRVKQAPPPRDQSPKQKRSINTQDHANDFAEMHYCCCTVLRHSRDLRLRCCRSVGELRHCRRQGPGALHPAKSPCTSTRDP
jgi:hypothetical protein